MADFDSYAFSRASDGQLLDADVLSAILERDARCPTDLLTSINDPDPVSPIDKDGQAEGRAERAARTGRGERGDEESERRTKDASAEDRKGKAASVISVGSVAASPVRAVDVLRAPRFTRSCLLAYLDSKRRFYEALIQGISAFDCR